MRTYIGWSPCPCGELIIAPLTGRIKKCDEHPSKSCWLWEWQSNIKCPKCGATQLYLHQPESMAQVKLEQQSNIKEA